MFKFVFLFHGFPVAERRLEADVLFDGVRRRPSLLAPALFRGGVKSDVPVVGGDVCPGIGLVRPPVQVGGCGLGRC